MDPNCIECDKRIRLNGNFTPFINWKISCFFSLQNAFEWQHLFRQSRDQQKKSSTTTHQVSVGRQTMASTVHLVGQNAEYHVFFLLFRIFGANASDESISDEPANWANHRFLRIISLCKYLVSINGDRNGTKTVISILLSERVHFLLRTIRRKSYVAWVYEERITSRVLIFTSKSRNHCQIIKIDCPCSWVRSLAEIYKKCIKYKHESAISRDLKFLFIFILILLFASVL